MLCYKASCKRHPVRIILVMVCESNLITIMLWMWKKEGNGEQKQFQDWNSWIQIPNYPFDEKHTWFVDSVVHKSGVLLINEGISMLYGCLATKPCRLLAKIQPISLLFKLVWQLPSRFC